MNRLYSGSGPATAIVWTLHSDARFVYHGWNMVAELEMLPTANVRRKSFFRHVRS